MPVKTFMVEVIFIAEESGKFAPSLASTFFLFPIRV